MRFEEIPISTRERAREGQADALESLCLLVQPDAYAVLLSLLRNHEDASDALQESMVRMIRFLPHLRDLNAFPGWLMRLLVNQAAVTYKHRSRPVVDITSLDPSAAQNAVAPTASAPLSPRRAAENHEMAAIINEAISHLPERQKAAIVLFEMEQLSIRKVAEIMELTDGAVKFHLHEARKNVRLALQEAGIANAALFEGTQT